MGFTETSENLSPIRFINRTSEQHLNGNIIN